MTDTNQEQFLTDSEVETITGLSYHTRLRLRKKGEFPEPITIGQHAGMAQTKRFLASEVHQWMGQQIAASRAA